jgi:hypothetical protein
VTLIAQLAWNWKAMMQVPCQQVKAPAGGALAETLRLAAVLVAEPWRW